MTILQGEEESLMKSGLVYSHNGFEEWTIEECLPLLLKEEEPEDLC